MFIVEVAMGKDELYIESGVVLRRWCSFTGDFW